MITVPYCNTVNDYIMSTTDKTAGSLQDADNNAVGVIREYVENGCGCTLQCSKRFTFDEIMKLRSDNFELSTAELDLFIKGQLRAVMDTSTATVTPR